MIKFRERERIGRTSSNRTSLWQIFFRLIRCLILATLINGCGSHHTSNTGIDTRLTNSLPSIARPPPSYLRIPLDGPVATLDPGLTEDTNSIELVEQLFLGLTDFDPETYEVVPELAARWMVDDSGTVYTFYLRTNVFWSDGKPVTAEDVTNAIRRNILPATKAPYAHVLYLLKNAEAIHAGKESDITKLGVHVVDQHTLKFELNHAASFFPALAGLWIYRPLPMDCIAKYGEQWTEPDNIVTNGSYLLKSWNHGELLTMKKNPRYYDAANIAIDEIHFLVVNESSMGLIMFENNDLDILGGPYQKLPLNEMMYIKTEPSLRSDYHKTPIFCTYYYGFNTKKPPVDNPLVRRAITAAIDRNLLVGIITGGDEEPAKTFTRPPIFGSVDPHDTVGISFNPNRAREWLAEAGYPNGEGFPDIELIHNQSEVHAQIARAVKMMLKHYLNIDITIVSLEWDEFMKSITQPNTPHMYRFGWCADYPDANNFLHDVFHPQTSPNRIGWDNQEFANTVDAAIRTSNATERKALYRRAEQILTAEQAAIVPLYFYTAQYLVKPRVKNWYSMALGGQHIRNWKLE